MLDVSYAIRSQPLWWEKCKDQEIQAKWKKEAMEQNIRNGRLQEAEVDYLLDELANYEKMRDEKTGIQVRILRQDSGRIVDTFILFSSAVLCSTDLRVRHTHPSRAPKATQGSGIQTRKRARLRERLASSI